MVHSTMVPQATTIPIRNVVISQAMIGKPLPPRSNPSIPPGYRALNTSISYSAQVPSGGSGPFIPLGYNDVVFFVPTPTQVFFEGSHVPPPPSLGGSGPSGSNPLGGTGISITYGFQIPVGGQSELGGQPQIGAQPQFGGKPHIGAQPQLGGKPQVGVHNPLYGQNAPVVQYLPWHLIFQGNLQSSGVKHPQVNSFLPPNLGQPYLSSLNPTWGLNVQPNVPFQGNVSTQPNPICHDSLLISRLLMVLLVYLQGFPLKINSFHK
jgi:hypothetical protein